jgi:hypothetical protein
MPKQRNLALSWRNICDIFLLESLILTDTDGYQRYPNAFKRSSTDTSLSFSSVVIEGLRVLLSSAVVIHYGTVFTQSIGTPSG